MVFLAGVVAVGLGTIGLNASTIVAATLVQAIFAVYFLRHLTFAISALQTVPLDLHSPPVQRRFTPPVTVLVACRNEVSVVENLVHSMLAIDYPRECLQLIVVDDNSDDGTALALQDLALLHPELTVVHRPGTAAPGKPAALNTALDQVSGEIVIVFDADHEPRRDVITRLLRHFEDPRVAAAQGRCAINNGNDSLMARMVAVDYSAGYLVNVYGRQAIFHLPAYGGANCAVRTSTLREMGGWNPTSVAEDTDLTIRLSLAGHLIRYDVTAVDEEEGVLTLSRYWRQRYRWARGHQQVCRDYRRAVLSSKRYGIAQKVETMMFLFAFHIPIITALAVGLAVLWITGIAQPLDPLSTFVLWTLLFLGPLLELGAGILLGGHPRRDAILLVCFLPLFFVSAALCTKAWLDVILGRGYIWVRTTRAAGESPAAASVSAEADTQLVRGPTT